ncbi:uncharacterized protein LOC106872446 [Octopus bimaculoides]|uniref:uncharacterized protein LOC106872446 n=1 Tax=Octopus bimaculoides TaxID=37653 RepID=UPI00071D1966|nr:uncharacterized protein LOC106872446 [Octopus bimaculoides]|eukprot:XP_014774935.1 PREDICTED: uncharacterized protein LOC106872446 [Octopus bimaculoides]
MRISESLNEQFISVFTPPLRHMQVSRPVELFITIKAERKAVTIEYTNIEEEDVILAIDDVDANAAAGPDRFPAILLKSCKRVLAKPLQLLLQSFLANGKLPVKLMEGIICPIHKGESRC